VDSRHPETLLVSGGRPPRAPGSPVGPAIVPTSTYVAGPGCGYGREGNPSVADLEDVLGGLEGGRALAFSSGMAAAEALLVGLPPGAGVLTGEVTYNGVYQRMAELAERGSIRLHRAALATAEPHALLAGIDGPIDLLWCETPSNPLVEVTDVPALAAAVRARHPHALVVVDSTLGGPLRQQPLAWGADVVLHSATKSLSGHSDLLLGVLVVAAGATGAERWQALVRRRKLGGAMPSPFDAWLALRGLRTFAVRTERSEATARLLAGRLAADARVTRVRYPGFGSVLAVDFAATPAQVDDVVAGLRVWWNATSLGGVESLAERRRRWPDEPEAVPETLVRLSVGLEHPEDLWADLHHALAVVLGQPRDPVAR